MTANEVQQIVSAVHIALKPQFEAIDKRFISIDNRFTSLDKKIDKLSQDVSDFREEVNSRFDRLEMSTFEIDQRTQVLEYKSGLPTPRFRKLPKKLFHNPKEVTEKNWPPNL